ncbi:hypothetical protein B0H17DRAFT_1135020 [Mycena rosella]|uniref:Uncharacterized protein n=1 Tax=Mycena rosella TaxID=1033263 RepID=A0AAD7DG36_MYCRO|nr:hypothetical protein B0H17DRAFT_1135020 [Mycena rosella]
MAYKYGAAQNESRDEGLPPRDSSVCYYFIPLAFFEGGNGFQAEIEKTGTRPPKPAVHCGREPGFDDITLAALNVTQKPKGHPSIAAAEGRVKKDNPSIRAWHGGRLRRLVAEMPLPCRRQLGRVLLTGSPELRANGRQPRDTVSNSRIAVRKFPRRARAPGPMGPTAGCRANMPGVGEVEKVYFVSAP